MNELNPHADNSAEARLQESISNAYPSMEPTDALRQRVAMLAEQSFNRHPVERPSIGRFRLVKAFATFALLTLVLGGSLAWRYFFGRLGETAIQLIPSSAALVVTLDTNPSEVQAPLFLRIKNALQTAHLNERAEQTISRLAKSDASPISEEIRPYLTTSFAIAMLDTPRPNATGLDGTALLLAVTDPAKVDGLLASSGNRERQAGISYYRLRAGKQVASYAMVIANYLVFSTNPGNLGRIKSTYEGRNPSVAALKEYREARAELPADANVMCFISPGALADIDEQGKKLGIAPFHETRWMALSATLRDEGIAFDFRAPVEAGRSRLTQATPVTDQPISTAAFKQLPAGPYGVIALSNPGSYWTYAESMVTDGPQVRAQLDSGISDFERQTGISISQDILPALRGRTWLAVYPNADDATAAPEGLLVVDDSNGAHPSRLAEKVRVWLEKLTGDGGEPGPRFIPSRQGDITIWRLDPKSSSNLEKSAGSVLNSVQVSGSESNQNQLHSSRAATEDPRGITAIYAQVGESIIIATSESMLQRALAAHHGLLPTLAEDPAYAAMRRTARPGAQSLVMINLAAIMERLAPTLRSTMKESSVPVDDVVNLFGRPDIGLVGSSEFDGKFERGSLFFPVDYTHLINLLSAASKEVGSHKSADPVESDKDDSD